jgi:pimeloyl-ACP methyl ester carboxylesterase
MSKENKFNRRNFLRNAAMTFTAAEIAMISPAGAPFRKESAMTQKETPRTTQKDTTKSQQESTKTGQGSTIRPFNVKFPEEALVDLRQRIKATRWPDKETVKDTSQGVPLGLIQDLAQYWRTTYDWRKLEENLNALPQFMTTIDGLDIHFIHVQSKQANALPLIVTHGWPGSIIEQLKIIDPLTNPTAHGANATDAFHLVIPSIPGYGFSARPTTTGWGPDHVARAWVELMKRLGYTKFVAAGGDIGALINDAMAKQAPPELLGMHTNFPQIVPPDVAKALQCGDPPPATLSADEKRSYEQRMKQSPHIAYVLYQRTRPQTLYGLADSPVNMAAWLLDHGDGDDQPAAAITSAIRGTHEHLTRDDVLDNYTLYWLTNTGVSAARFYWEIPPFGAANVSVPAAVSEFPGELFSYPRSWTEQAYHKLIYYNKVAKGGHFAAWEQPELYATEIQAGLRSLR